jgi:peptide/nickel transport system substrate-binding protein
MFMYLTSKNRILSFLGAVFFLFFLLEGFWGCVYRPNLPDKIFRMNIAAGLTSLDPAFAKSEANIWITSQLFNGLVEYDSSLRIQPCIAKYWRISDSGKTYTFTLRNDVFFHPHSALGENRQRGRKVKAQDFVFSFTRIATPSVASPGQWIFNNRVEGIDEFQKNKAPYISGFVAPNDTTLIIRLQKPFFPFLGLLAMPYCYVIPPEAVTKKGSNFTFLPIGTGPFIFKTWQENKQLILLKNKCYFEKGLPTLEAITVSFIGNKLTALAHFLNQELDWIDGIDPVASQEILTPEGLLRQPYARWFRLQTGTQLTTEYIGMYAAPDCGSRLHKKELRKALNFAIDRRALVHFVLKNMGLPAQYGIVPPGIPGFTGVAGYAYSQDSARKYLQLAGYPLGKNLPALQLYTTPTYLKIAEFLQKSWEEIGVPIQIELIEGATLREMAAQGKLSLWRASWMADYADAENFLALFYGPHKSPSGPNFTRYDNPAYNHLYERLLKAAEPGNPTPLYQEMERLIIADAPIIPLYYYKIVRLVNKRFKYVPQASLSGWLPLKYVR